MKGGMEFGGIIYPSLLRGMEHKRKKIKIPLTQETSLNSSTYCKGVFQISFNHAIANGNCQNIIFIISSSYIDKKYIYDIGKSEANQRLTIGETR
jgi:hypothetical protein